jgi:hypothetical protein
MHTILDVEEHHIAKQEPLGEMISPTLCQMMKMGSIVQPIIRRRRQEISLQATT